MDWVDLEGFVGFAFRNRSRLPPAQIWEEVAAGNTAIAEIPKTGWELFLWLSAFARSGLCNDESRALIVQGLVSDPDRVAELCNQVAGTKPGSGDVWWRFRRSMGVETLAEKAERLKPRPYVRKRIHRDPDREAQRLLMEDPEARARIGIAMGGREQGRQIKGILCPNCNRKSVYYYVDPNSNRDKSARCHHRNSCQFWATVYELGRGYGG